ncbi:MAG: hypothetical protein J7K26_00335, partial [Candidatus Aenigmarchaeota archaeon]|nr:hypothetical protein [Candidatus Aenigmarchaeota archaeon]
LNIWCNIRKLEKPIYIKTKLNYKQILKKLKKLDNYALTLLSAAWIRIKFMKTSRIEIYVSKKHINKFIKEIGEKSKKPTNFIIFPCDKYIFEGSEKIDSLILVSVVQNYVDLIAYGGTGIRVALKLAEKYNLLGV